MTVVALSSLAPMVLPLGVRSLAFAESICRLSFLCRSITLIILSLQPCMAGWLSLVALCFMSEFL